MQRFVFSPKGWQTVGRNVLHQLRVESFTDTSLPVAIKGSTPKTPGRPESMPNTSMVKHKQEKIILEETFKHPLICHKVVKKNTSSLSFTSCADHLSEKKKITSIRYMKLVLWEAAGKTNYNEKKNPGSQWPTMSKYLG